jgi:outer membrane protein assembly factor BamD
LVEVSNAYAERSVFDKKEERLKQSIEFAQDFAQKYPDSTYDKKVKNLMSESETELETHYRLKEQYESRSAEARRLREEEERNQKATEALRNTEN